jgi:colanic acid/amylovoran biosynthesis glycosyltransferase
MTDVITSPMPPPHAGVPAPRVAYVMSRFPKLTETFVLYELLAVEDAGVPVEVYPLRRERAPVTHPEAAGVVARAHFLPFLSLSIIATQLHHLRHRRRAYLEAFTTVVRENWGSRKLFLPGLVVFPKAAHLARLMQAAGVTHVHCHFATHPALVGFVVTRLTGIPFSFTAHGSDLHVDRHMLAKKVESAAFVATISDHNRDVIVEECGGRWSEKVHVLRCGVSSTVFEPAPRQSERPFTVVCVGTLHEVKGQTHLLEAVARLAAGGVDVRCRLVGSGPDRPRLTAQAQRLGISDRVEFSGALPRAAVAEALRHADALVTPSVPTRSGRREGIPVVILEAMSAGLPVVASRLSGIPELVEHDRTGLLVEPGDEEELAEALRRLHDDERLRRELGRAGRQRVVEGHSIEGTARRLISLIGGAP